MSPKTFLDVQLCMYYSLSRATKCRPNNMLNTFEHFLNYRYTYIYKQAYTHMVLIY